MVICEYFLNGQCRFGSRCNKDHIDLRTLLKGEIGNAVTGKQWMLSCFGPFKGSVVIPNFIPDRSFEEVRLSFLEAKKTGNTQGHTNELMMQYNDAMSKMNQLKNCTPETIQLLVNIYNQSLLSESNKTNNSMGNSQTTGNVFNTPNNVFGQTQSQMNVLSAGSIFSGQQPVSNTMSTGSIFGNSQPSNPFQASSQTSIFGAPKPQQNETQASPFSFSVNQTAQPQQQQSSIFGSSTQSNNIFGGSSAFSQPTTNSFSFNQQQQQPSSTFSFAGSSIFGQQQQQQQVQTQQPVQQQQQQFPAFGNTGGSIFGQQNQQQNSGSVFGGMGMGQDQQNQQQQQQQPSTISQPPTGLFGQFGQQQQQQQSTNLFAQVQTAPTSLPSSNVFGQVSTQQPQQSSSIFQIDQSKNMANMANPFVSQPPPPIKIDERAYSEVEKLTQDELNAFQAEDFILGKIPLKPPPRQFCV